MNIRSSQFAAINTRIFLLLFGVVCVLATSLPLFQTGFFRPHDYTHAARIAEMNRALLAGEFPVRWSENFGFGYGMPLFNFYAPLPYYVAQIPYMLTGDAIMSIKVLYFINAILAFAGMYLFSSKYWENTWAGMISGILFTFSSYRALNLYVRGAIGEVMAMVLLPIALYGVLLLVKKSRAGVIITVISLAGILLTHNLSGMLAVLIVIGFGVLLDQSRSFLRSLCASVAGAIGLSAFYIFPAFFEKGYTRVAETITVGYFDFHNHFVAIRQLFSGTWGYGGSVVGLEDGISFALGWLPIFFILIGISAHLFVQKKLSILRQAQNTFLKFQFPKIFILLCLFGSSIFMATNKSEWLWDQISILKYMQFPWRFLGNAHVFAAALAGASIVSVRKYARTSLVVVTVVLLLAIGLHGAYFFPEKIITSTDEFYSTSPEFIRRDLSHTLNDYLPKAVSDDNLPDPIFETISPLTPSTIEIQSHKPTQTTAKVHCIVNCELNVNIFQFPGWQAMIDGKRADLIPLSSFPIYRLSVPTGTHDISVQLMNTPIRMVSNVLSIVSVLGLGFYYVRYRKY